MAEHEALIERLYDGFNNRDIPGVLAMLAQNVEWANGIDGGHERGREAVRAYWTTQWKAIKPTVTPTSIADRAPGVVAVEVHQVVHDMNDTLLLDETVRHVFQIDDGLIVRFDIENAGGLAGITH